MGRQRCMDYIAMKSSKNGKFVLRSFFSLDKKKKLSRQNCLLILNRLDNLSRRKPYPSHTRKITVR